MNLRKRRIILTILMATVVSVSACGNSKPNAENSAREEQIISSVQEEQVTSSAGATHNASICNIDTDKLPYNEESVYQQLFDLNNKIEVELDVSEDTMKQLQRDYEKYEEKGSKSPIYREADMRITITTEEDSVTYRIDNVGIRMKGNTSRTSFYDEEDGQYNLIHFKVDFGERTFATLEKLELRWNKNDDNTYVREYYAYEMYRDFGILAPHINLATMNVAGEQQGVFTICEPVDDVFIDKYVAKEDRDGNLYKCNWTGIGANLTKKCTIGVEDEEAGRFYNYDLKTNKKEADHSGMKNLIAVLNNRDVTKEDIAEVVDMDNFLAFEAVSYFTGNPDDIRNNYNNYYIYFLESSGKAIFIPYDVDRVFGLTKDWNPLGNAMTSVNPFSTKTESMGITQENPLYIHTVNKGGYYTEEFKEVLQKVAESKWLTVENFTKSYETAYAIYVNDTKPAKMYENAQKHNFSMNINTSAGLGSTKGNASFSEYVEAKLKSFYSYME